MKRYLLVPVLALAALAIPIVATSSWALERTAPARFNQPCRIARGVRNGAITGREFRHLQRQQQRIHGARHRAWADGRLTAREQRRLLNMRRRANRHIYRAKHNCARNGAYRRAPARRAPCPAPRLKRGGGFFHGAVTQPGWAVGWNANLD
jgi:hypothetical protein